MPAFNLGLFLLGCLGGLLPDILRIIRNRYKVNVEAYFKNLNFWLGTLLLVVIGGLTAWVMSTQTAKDALIYGYASPQILSQLAASVRTEPVERGVSDARPTAPPFSLLKWWGS